MKRFILSLSAVVIVALAVGADRAQAQTDNSYFVGAISKAAVSALGAGVVPSVVSPATGTIALVPGTALTTGVDVGSSAYDLHMTGNVTLTVSGFTAGVRQEIFLILRQDATGGRTVTWPTSIIWSGGTAPTFVTTANTVQLITLMSDDGGTTLIGK
jgi:hypothetical protein